MITRGFLINLGVTILASVLLFLYFRHRFKQTEHKVNTIFQLVQNHTQNSVMSAPPPIKFEEKNDLIHVSDDDMNSDSEEESDSDSESDSDDGNNTNNSATPQPQQIFMGVGEIKQVAVSLTPDVQIGQPVGPLIGPITTTKKQNDDEDDDASDNDLGEDDLDDVGSLSSQDKEPNVINIMKAAEDNISLQESIKSQPDYSKLTVPTLKEIAANKGFTNFRKLRKQALVDLLSN